MVQYSQSSGESGRGRVAVGPLPGEVEDAEQVREQIGTALAALTELARALEQMEGEHERVLIAEPRNLLALRAAFPAARCRFTAVSSCPSSA